MQQNTSAWLEYRKKMVGASDVPAIMGVSPWRTRHDIFLSKTTEQVQETSFIQQKGHDKEVIARIKYELITGEEYPATLIQSESCCHMGASLDGYNKEKNHHIEIKYCGKSFKEEIPLHYMHQCQYQMFLTGGTCELVWITDSDDIEIHKIELDLKMIKEIICEVNIFWEMVKNNKYVDCISDEKLDALKKYKTKKEEIKKLEKELEELEALVLSDLPKKDYETEFGAIRWIERKGNVDYAKIEELKDVDLDKYRKKSSHYWSIK